MSAMILQLNLYSSFRFSLNSQVCHINPTRSTPHFQYNEVNILKCLIAKLHDLARVLVL